MNLVKVISASSDDLRRRVIKFLRFGKSDVQTSLQAMPWGVDCHPIKDAVAVYAETGIKGKTVVIGYINPSALTAIGEHRTFSTDADGNRKFYIWQKNDGTCEIGGSSNFMVRFNELKTGFDTLKTEFNAHVHTGNLGAPTTPPSVTAIASIDSAKIDEIKTL